MTEAGIAVWIDAQLPPSLARWFRTKFAINAVHVEELGLHRARDPEIFAAARVATVPVVIITKDDDFAKLVDQHGPPPQIVWVRCGNVSNQELRRILHEAWPRAVTLLTHGEPLIEVRRRLDSANGVAPNGSGDTSRSEDPR